MGPPRTASRRVEPRPRLYDPGARTAARRPRGVFTLTATLQVLVLDAEPESNAALVEGLRTLGVAPTGVASMDDARAELARGQYRAIVLSLQLPEGNPLDLLSSLSDGRPLPPLIVVSRIVRRRDLIQAIRTPVCDFLEQPVTLPDLAEALERSARSAGVVPRSSANQPDHVVRGVRHAVSLVAGADGAAAACARTLTSRPTLRAAWAAMAAEESLPGPMELAQTAPSLRPLRFASIGLAAALLAESFALVGPWRVQAEAAAMRVVDYARVVRAAAPTLGIDPDEAFLAAVFRGLGEVMLMMQAARRYAGQDPAPELLARLEQAGPRTAGALLASWGMTEALRLRFSVLGADGASDGSPLAELLERPDGVTAAVTSGVVTSGVGFDVLLRAARESDRAGPNLPVQDGFPGVSRLVTESRSMAGRLQALTGRGVRVTLGTDDLQEAASLLREARMTGLWYDLRLPQNGAQARAPVDVVAWERTTPVSAELRFVGPQRHAERLRAVAFLALNRRRTVRVPGDDRRPILAPCIREDGVTIGEFALYDLSTTGLGVLADPASKEQFAVGKEFHLSLPLPTNPEPVRMLGDVVHAHVVQVEEAVDGTRHWVLRVGFALRPLSGGRVRLEKNLSDYVMRRQRETLRGRT